MPGKDFKNQLGAIPDHAVKRSLNVLALSGGKVVVEEHQPEARRRPQLVEEFADVGSGDILPFGVTGPSIMGGTGDRNLRANCFAVTPGTATALRNRTRVSEYLHQRLE